MRNTSIRMRLTLSYCLVLTITLGFLGAALFFVMRQSIYAAIDEDLKTRLDGVHRFMDRMIPRISGDELRGEFREHSGLRPGGDLLRVYNDRNEIVFQSDSIRNYRIDFVNPGTLPIYKNVTVSDRPLRVLMARVTIKGQEYRVLLATTVNQAQEAVTRFGWLLVGSIPAVLLLAALGGYWMGRRALAPVDEITRTARSISVHNLSRRLSLPNTGDELHRLTETLNDMMSRLQMSFQKVTQFTADASHELRTPIALIRTTAELSLRKERDSTEYRSALVQVLEEAERTTSLIEALMVLARSDSGAAALNLSPADVAEVVSEACERGRALANTKQITFEQDVPDAAFFAELDPPAFGRMLLILIDNAVKYTPRGGRIIVSLSVDSFLATITIQDSGIGISPDDMPHIFERFYRADKARSRDAGGAGLGLSIAKWIADAHQASIEVHSALEGGSIFHVIIPLTEQPVSAA